MPHVRIDMHRELKPRMSAISDAVHEQAVRPIYRLHRFRDPDGTRTRDLRRDRAAR